MYQNIPNTKKCFWGKNLSIQIQMNEVIVSVVLASETVVVVVLDPIQWLYVNPQPYSSYKLWYWYKYRSQYKRLLSNILYVDVFTVATERLFLILEKTYVGKKKLMYFYQYYIKWWRRQSRYVTNVIDQSVYRFNYRRKGEDEGLLFTLTLTLTLDSDI